MGEVVLKIETEHSIRTLVATYSVTGNLESTKSTIKLESVKPDDEVSIPNIAPGKWTFTVIAYDEDGNQIGSGTKQIVLLEGQRVNLKVPVEFISIQLTLGDQDLSEEALRKDYDGTESLKFAGEDFFIVDTLKTPLGKLHAGDDIVVEARATYADKNVGSNKSVTISYILNCTKDSEIEGKYLAPETYTVKRGEIQKKKLTIGSLSFPNSQNKVYDGSKTLPVTVDSIDGVIPGDDVTVTATAVFDDSDAGDNKGIVISYTLDGKDKANYAVPIADTTKTGNITSKPLRSIVQGHDKRYDGTDTATGSIRLDGIVGSDSVSATCSFCFSDVQIGSDKTVNVSGITLSGAQASNYSLATDHMTTTASIGKASYNMDGIIFEGASLTYDGLALKNQFLSTTP